MVMQNSSNSYKPKSSKFSRSEDTEESKDQADDSLDNVGGGSNLKGIPTIVICQRDNRHRGRSSRGRDDGRPPFRGSERRGGRGSRGGPFRSRGDRDGGESSYSSRSKFQESMTRGSSSYKHSNDSDVFKNRDGVSLLPEDCRISKLLRRLCQEDDLEKFFSITKQLKEALLLPDNGRYIRRSLDYILDSLLDVLHSGPSSDARFEGSKCLGVAGVALEHDAKRLIDWVFSTYQRERNNDVRVLLMKSLQHMLQIDAKHPKMKDLTNGLMTQLQHALESTDKPEILNATGDAILALNKSYPETFSTFFRDTVDILIGWHIDTSQPQSVTQFASQALQQLRPCWVADLPFSLNLLSQFLEDMEAYSEDLVNPVSGRSSPEDEPPPSPEDCLLRITSIIQVFTTVTLSLGPELTPRDGSPVTITFLSESLEKVLTTALAAMDHEKCKENVIIAANECGYLLLGVLGTRGSCENLYLFIKKQLELSPTLAVATIISGLTLTAKTVRECSANLPESLIHDLLGPGSPLLQMRFCELPLMQEASLEVYHSLLSLKNIPLLQEAYRYVLQDLGRAYSLIVPTVTELCPANNVPDLPQFTPYEQKDADRVVLFLFNALSDLARASNSIIGMWALKPTVMELLAVKLLPEDSTLSTLSPILQYGLIYLLYSHCTRYNNFVSSTGLVVQGRSSRPQLPGLPASLEMSANSSPSSGHLTLILRLMTNTLTKDNIWVEVRALCLRWAGELISQAKSSLVGLMSTSNFSGLLQALIKSAVTDLTCVLKGVATCLQTLLSLLPNYTHQAEVLRDMVHICVLHVSSPDPEVRQGFHRVLLLLPWHMTLHELAVIATSRTGSSITDRTPVNKQELKFNLELVKRVNKLHCVRTDCGEMGNQHFRSFMSHLLQGTQHSEVDWLSELLSCCLPPQFTGIEDDTAAWLRLATSGSQSAQLTWCAWQAAQFCVTYKLRTPLGKPQETFTSIEGAIKNLARELNNEGAALTPVEGPLSSTTNTELRRARLLLEFLEHLEKAIYNAAEGCAIAMPSQSKPVRVFFHTNKAVCGEWVSRIRWVTILVASHSGMPSVVVRHGFCLLQDHLDQGNTQGGELERAAVLVARALVSLREPEALHGLYAWCRDKAGRRFPWVKIAALQAAARYEDAVLGYSKLPLTEVSEVSDSLVPAFVSDQMSECLRLLGDWSKLTEWKEEHADLSNIQSTVSSALSLDHVKALSDFDQLGEAAGHGPWAAKSVAGGSWKPSRVVAMAEESLTALTLNLCSQDLSQEEIGKLVESCTDSLHSLQGLLEEGLLGRPLELCSEVLVLEHVANALLDHLATPSVHSNPFLSAGADLEQSSVVLNKVLWWSDRLQQLHHAPANAQQLQLTACRCARKEGNTGLARRLLLAYWRGKTQTLDLPDDEVFASLEPALWVKQGAGLALKETAKLLYSVKCRGEGTSLLARAALASARCAAEGGASQDTQEVASCLLLSLTNKLTSHDQLALQLEGLSLSEPLSPLVELLCWGATVADTRMLTEWDIKIPDATDDAHTQQLLQLSLISCPRNAKAWSQFASWSFHRGRQISGWEDEALQVSDIEKVAEILGPISSVDQCQTVLEALREVRQDKPDEELIESLQSLLPYDTANLGEKIEQLISLWGQRTQSHRYYHACAIAYFKYLQLCETQENTKNDEKEESLGESTLTATLRLLRLIVKHATPLQDVLESGLALTPTTPWKGIIPQLFARLSHPELYVRRRLSELLCRLAADAPHLILFPAVVGCSSSKAPQKSDNLFSSCIQEGDEEEEEEELEDEDSTAADESQTSVLRSCFLAMVDTLSQQAPASTSQVRLLVTELRRITVLWDELWLGCLIQHHPDITRRLSQLEAELKRLEENESLDDKLRCELAKEKYRIIMKPIIMIFEQLQTMTSVTPETPHEQAFQEKFSGCIVEALETLKNPPEDKPINPHECWQPFKHLQKKLHERAQRRGAHTLKLVEISPALANLKDSAIAMPGLSQSQPLVTIAAMENIVSVLPTKTRPKKLVLMGSDGRTYTYLFKGLEDLHLDERIMQFLSIANTMMARKKGAKFQARHYSVVPLGARSGLISWVDGVQPMFGLYKRWQQREATTAQLRNQQATCPNIPSTVVLRPSELFYNKLAPLLAERGIAVESRKEWPLSLLKTVLTSLINETPKDLLAKELWCTSANAADWWQVTRTYARSVAVMSVIGYIIGLGDRHLDNLLINLSSGEVVHIDYNVCFEKGQTLRVPEKVPFRMTPNLQTALGVTGCEGIFRLSCEHVLSVLKRGRETLLTLLEAFVYDPLIDWTPGSEAGYTGAAYGGQSQRGSTEPPRPSRRELEREAAHAMLAVRVTEMRHAWTSNRDELLAARSHLVEDLESWGATGTDVRAAQEELQDAHQQMALLKEAAATGASHPLFSLHARHTTHVHAQATQVQAAAALGDIALQSCQQNARVQAAVTAVRGPELPGWASELGACLPQDDGGRELFDLVREFLISAGQSTVMAQCEQSETECARLVNQLQMVLRSCLELLGQYSVVAALFPAHHLECQHTQHQERLAKELLANLTADRCRAALKQIRSLSVEPSLASREQAAQYHTQLQLATNLANIRLQAAYKRLSIEGPEDPTQRLESALIQARAQVSAYATDSSTVTAVIVTALKQLCALNGGLLTLEAAAASSGESLVDLTLLEGDWFLDKLLQLSGVAAELADTLVPLATSTAPVEGQLASAFHCLKTAHKVYKGLEDLLWNVSTIIVPEALVALTTQQPSVLAMTCGLAELVALVGRPLTNLCKEVEMNLRYFALDLPIPHPLAKATCRLLREGLERLLTQREGEALSPGQMLLMGFNGLFERLQHDAAKLILALSSLSTPPAWGKLDHLHKARTLTWTIMKEGLQSVIEDLFVVRRLQVMHEFLSLCGQVGQGFSGDQVEVPATFVSEETLVQPIRRFSADFVRHQLIGLMPQTIALAVCVILEEVLNVNLTEHVEKREVGVENRVSLEEICRGAGTRLGQEGRLGHVATMLAQLETTWRLREGAALAQREAEAARATAQRLQLRAAAHAWLKDFTQCGRPIFITELRKTMGSLMTLQPCLSEAREQQQTLVGNITQRLKWAAGANPTLSEVLSAFNDACVARQERLQGLQQLSAQLVATSTAVLHLETLRNSNAETIAYNAGFVQLLMQCEQSLSLMETAGSVPLSPAEESLALLLPLNQPVEMAWILSAESLVAGRVKALGSVLSSQHAERAAALEGVRTGVQELRAVLTSHHSLMAGVRSLLRTLAKPGEGHEGLGEYLVRYRNFSEQFSTVVRCLGSDELDAGQAAAVKEQLAALENLIVPIYDELLKLPTLSEGVEEKVSVVGRGGRPPLLRQESVCMSPQHGVPSLKPPPAREKVLQEKNAYALSVVRRVRAKLEGRDPDPSKKATVQEQVDFIINEATSLDNLCLLYEGWTPWV